jgi:hypothetical protein
MELGNLPVKLFFSKFEIWDEDCDNRMPLQQSEKIIIKMKKNKKENFFPEYILFNPMIIPVFYLAC